MLPEKCKKKNKKKNTPLQHGSPNTDTSLFQHSIGILNGTNDVQLLADLFLRAFQAHFRQGLLKNKDRN